MMNNKKSGYGAAVVMAGALTFGSTQVMAHGEGGGMTPAAAPMEHAAMDHSGHQMPAEHAGMDHAAMDHSGHQMPAEHAGMDHATMDHRGHQMPAKHAGMDHAAMDHSGHQMPAEHAGMDHAAMDHSGHQMPAEHAGMDHAAMDHSAHQRMVSSAVDDAKQVNIRLDDMELRNRSGQPVKFASEAVGDRLVVLSIFYSSCTTVCPVISAIFADVQAQLGERLGQEATLISLTVDPTTDTPQRLSAYAAKFQAAEGWQWLTGRKRAVDQVLTGLGLFTADYTEHPAAVLIGDGKSGQWSRFYGFPSADQIVAELDRYQLARAESATATAQLNKE